MPKLLKQKFAATTTTPTAADADACCPWRGEGVSNCPTEYTDYSTGSCDSAMDKYCMTQDVELDEFFKPRKTSSGETIYTAPNLFRSGDRCKEWMRYRKQGSATDTFDKVCMNTTNKVFLDKAKTKVGYAIDLPECACIKARENLAKSGKYATVAPECVLTSCVLQKGDGWSTYDQSINTCNVTYCEMNLKDVGIAAGDSVDPSFTVKQSCGTTQPPPSDPNVKPPVSNVEDVSPPSSSSGSGDSSDSSGSDGTNIGMAIGISVGIAVLVLVIAFFVMRARRNVSFGRRMFTRVPRRA